MAAGNTVTPTYAAPPMEVLTSPPITADEVTAKAAQKRYDGLVIVRNKAVKGKGSWYWAHFEPLLVHHSDSGLPKAVKLKCRHCSAVLTASNPSRSASVHLRRGTCPNFVVSSEPNTGSPNPISTVHPPPATNPWKRSSSSVGVKPSPSYNVPPLTILDSEKYCHDVGFPGLVSPSAAIVVGGGDTSTFGPQNQSQQPHFMLSGGKEDLCHLAMLEDSVKRLKSPKTSPGNPLTKSQITSALDYLSDWIYESGGSVSFSSLNHPKFKAFLTHVGLPTLSTRDFSGSRLDSKYEEARNEAEAKIRDAMFFQLSTHGWKQINSSSSNEHFISLSVNLPNGTAVFQRALFNWCSQLPSKYVEEVLLEAISEICRNSIQQCVGIIGDKFKNKALRNLEFQHPWMVNLSCQYQGVISLIKDLYKGLPLFMNVAESCKKLANFVNNKTHVRNNFRKYQIQEYGHSVLLRVPGNDKNGMMNFDLVFAMLEDIMGSARALQSLVINESYKIIVSMEETVTREFADMIRDAGFWNHLEAVLFIVRFIKNMAHEIETDRLLVGQCLPIWEELRGKLKDWCLKFRISEVVVVEKIFEKRFKKNYHPAWAAAYILDPLYLLRDASGKYLPPFKHLTPQQEKDVDKMITRLVPREEAHIAVMELMKWRTEGLDPIYAQAVQMKQRDPISGKMRIVNPQSSRLVWETYLTEFNSLRKIAVRLIFLHATSHGFECNPSFLRWIQALGHSRAGIDKAQKMIFIAAHSKLKRKNFSNEDEKDIELFATALANCEEDDLNEVFVDPSSI